MIVEICVVCEGPWKIEGEKKKYTVPYRATVERSRRVSNEDSPESDERGGSAGQKVYSYYCRMLELLYRIPCSQGSPRSILPAYFYTTNVGYQSSLYFMFVRAAARFPRPKFQTCVCLSMHSAPDEYSPAHVQKPAHGG